MENKRKLVRITGSTKLDRMVARNNMLAAGYTQLNKKDADGRSKFAKMWRQFVY
jgi:hypothetical protein